LSFAVFRDLGDRDDPEAVGVEKRRLFYMLYEELMPCCVGRGDWGPEQWVQGSISDGTNVTVSDEAFVVLCLENYWDGWTGRKGYKNKCTDKTKGNLKFGGWAGEGLRRFNTLCNMVHVSRNCESGMAADLAFKLYAVDKYGRDGRDKKKRNKAVEYTFGVFDELDQLAVGSEGFQRGGLHNYARI